MLRRNDSGTLVCLAVTLLLCSGIAQAEAPAAGANPELGETGGSAGGTAQGSASAGASAGGTWQPPTSSQVDAAKDTGPASDNGNTGPTPTTENMNSLTDHAGVAGHWGVGLFGVMGVPVMGCGPVAGGCTLDPAGQNTTVVRAPAIGVRYWLEEGMAIEVALGIGIQSGGRKVTVTGATAGSAEGNLPSVTAFAIHGGLPLVFAQSKHFAFEIIPELNIGFATGSWDDTTPANADVDLSGMLFELGGRIGAEIQFGFIGIPQLALQGTVGLHLRVENRSATANAPAGSSTETSDSAFRFGTTLQEKPWEIFTGNINAIYYF